MQRTVTTVPLYKACCLRQAIHDNPDWAESWSYALFGTTRYANVLTREEVYARTLPNKQDREEMIRSLFFPKITFSF